MALTIRDLEKTDKGGIFVLNKTMGIEKGRIVFPVPKANGMGSDAVIIPGTFIPIDLTEQVSRKQLLESSEFRKCVNSRRIEIITEEEYARLMGQEGAKEENDRLYNVQQAYMNTVQSLDNILDANQNNVVDPALASLQRNQAGRAEIASGDVNEDDIRITPAVLQVIASLEEDKEEMAAINTLRSLGELTEEDYRYVLRNAGKEFTQLRSFCSRNIQRITGKVGKVE